jgi:DNA mismatch repair protein MutS2
LLSVGELSAISNLLDQSIRLKRFMVQKEAFAPNICSYALSIYELPYLKEELERCIRHGHVSDQASHALARIRKQIMVTEDRMKKKLDQALKKYKPYLQDQLVTTRQNRFVIPVKKEHRKLVPGTVLDESTSGQTVFIEPYDISGFTQELQELRFAEAREEEAILYQLTEQVEQHQQELSVNLEAIGHYDFMFAKAKYSTSIRGRKVELNTEGIIEIRNGTHPLLGGTAVPLDFSIGRTFQALIITGPNTGGKTVCLKTVGLLTAMVQAGLLVPVDEGSNFSVFSNILLDIGDGQSIEHSLSTFSAHITNVIEILKVAGPTTLVLLDELASGTDPGEGVGLSIAVLEELYERGATLIATTHFDEIKRFAESTDGFQVARMEFDVQTLSPLYRLQIGEAGESYAFYIALRLGLPSSIVERSKQIARTTKVDEQSCKEDGNHKEDRNRNRNRNHVTVRDTLQDRALQKDENRNKGHRRPNRRDSRSFDKTANSTSHQFQIGDCVWIHSLKRTGIVCDFPDDRGNITVQVQKEKIKVNRKRLSLYVERDRLYPEDYDMNIVLQSKEVRKKRHIMERKHVEGVFIEWKDE